MGTLLTRLAVLLFLAPGLLLLMVAGVEAQGSLRYWMENNGSSPANATSADKCAPAESPISATRSGSIPSSAALARTNCTAALQS